MQTDMLIKYIGRMNETLEQLGFVPARVLDRPDWAEIELKKLSGPALQREQYQMIRRALEVTGRDDLGVLVGENISLMDFGPLGMLVASSSTGRMAFRRVFQFLAIAEVLWTAEHDLEGPEPYVAITFVESVPRDLHEYFLDEFAAAWNRFSVELAGQERWADAMQLPGAETAVRAAKSMRLGIPFEYGAPGFGFRFNCDMLDAPFVNANPAIAAMLEEQCARIVQGLPDVQADIERVRHVVIDRLPTVPTAPEIAAALGTSERSLRRLCAQHGTSVREIVLEVRMATACNHLRSSAMTVDQISYLAGYGSPPSFFHAFRNWAGVTPTAYREETARPPG